MADYTLSDRTQKLNRISKLISEMTNESEEKLVRFCVSKGFTFSEISEALGVTKQAISKKYPDLYKNQKEKNNGK